MKTNRAQVLKLLARNWVYGVHNSLSDLAHLGALSLGAGIDYDCRLSVEGRGLDKIIGGVFTPQGDDFIEVLRGELPQLYGVSGRDA
jgi:hypothetical protein